MSCCPLKTFACLGLLPLLLLAARAQAALPDEIQVYADDINAPGEFGLEVHVNTAPRGQRQAGWAGEVKNDHSLFVTPELSWGLTDTVDAGLYLPTARDSASGDFLLAGAKARVKWLPLQVPASGEGGFAGLNLELARVARRFEQYRSSAELRAMLGWRTPDWLLAVNPVLSRDLSDGAERRSAYGFGVKASRRVGEGLAAGLEYYTEQGLLGSRLPWAQQDNKLFAVLDLQQEPWGFNLGVGKGLSRDTEALTFKGIVEVGF